MLNLGIYNVVGSLNAMVFGSNKFRIRRSQSKVSYLAYRRERGAPDSEGSYKRTMSPTARLEDWQQQQHFAGSREHDDPVLIRVTPHHPHQLQQQQKQQQQSSHHHHHQHYQQQQQQIQQQPTDLPKSHSVDALHQRIEGRSSVHSSQVLGKLSHELTKKLDASENRSRSESNNNSNAINNNDCDDAPRHGHQDKRQELKERLSPQSVQVLNDRNRQLEREQRKLAASCELASPTCGLSSVEASNQGIQDFYRDQSATIEMTSRNVQLLNQRNALAERRINKSSSSTSSSSSSSSSSNSSSSSSNSSTSPVKDDRNDGSASNSNCNLRIKENGELRDVELVEKPATLPDSCVRSKESLACTETVRDTVMRRSTSCSSSTWSEPMTTSKCLERKEGDEDTAAECHATSRRKVSSPSQTEKSWTRSNSPRARSSQTEDRDASIELGKICWPRSRSPSWSLSGASKISSSCSSLGSPRYSPIERKNSPCVSPQPGIEGLTMVQRSEIVLRVNAATIDASSQTDVFYEDEAIDNKDSMQCQAVSEPRRMLREEIECEQLSRDLASELGPNDKLVPILVPTPEHKKPTDYVSGLFRVEVTSQSRPRRAPSLDASNSVTSVDTETEDDGKNETMPSTPTSPLSTSDDPSSSPLSASSAYFTTSEGKARFLTRYSRDVTEEDISVNSSQLGATTSSNDSFHLRQKKEELVLRLGKKVLVLREEEEAVREEGQLNEALGARVSSRVSAVARQAEASKYRLHVEEVGKITSLLLGLSGRLARAENALYGMPTNHPERKILESKRDKLMDQLEEAKILKNNIDKRSVNVSAILSKYLNDDEYADYQHFINMKAKLIMEGREIQDKVKLGEEQLAALKEAIN